jgi:hypothetical protein
MRTLLVLVLLGPGVAAQDLLGLERGAAGVPVRIDQIGSTTCRRVANCALPAPPSDAHSAPLGGIAFDADTGNVYSSDGRDFVCTTIACKAICNVPQIFPAVTGLGFNKFRRHLYTVHVDQRLRIWPVADSSPCPTFPIAECLIALTQGEYVTGVEFDERRLGRDDGRLFLLTSVGRLIIYREPAAPGCVEICRTMLPKCTTNPFTTYQGLAYDPSGRSLWVTDGKRLMRVTEAGCALTWRSCCDIDTVDSPLSGLARFSRYRSIAIGTGCTDARCLGCVPVLGARGAPAPHHPSFALTLANVPPQSTNAVLIAVGPPATAPVPFGCGKLWFDVASPYQVALPVLVRGTTPCGAAGELPLPFLPSAAIGLELTAQAGTACIAQSSIGLALSNGWTFRVDW